jgi:hypothetical protein
MSRFTAQYIQTIRIKIKALCFKGSMFNAIFTESIPLDDFEALYNLITGDFVEPITIDCDELVNSVLAELGV